MVKRIPMKRRKPVLAGLVVLALLCCTPWFMGVSLPRQLVLTWLGRQLHGSLQADSCSFGWFSGLHCRQLNYRSHDQRLHLSSAHLHVDKGLMPLVLAPDNVGAITLDGVELRILTSGGLEEPAPVTVSSRLLAWWNKKTLQLQVREARVLLQRQDALIPLLSGAGLKGGLETGSLHFAVRGRAGRSEEPNLRIEGFVNAPPEGREEPAHLLSNLTIVLQSGRVADLPQLPHRPLADVEGTAAGSCRVIRGVDGVLQLSLALSLYDLVTPALVGGNERLHLGRASLLTDLEHQGPGRWHLNQLLFDSDLVNVAMYGTLQEDVRGVYLTTEVSLPLLSEGLRQSLRMHPEARLFQGNLRCVLEAIGPGQQLPLDLGCEATDLRAVRGAEQMQWKQPFTFTARGAVDLASLRPMQPMRSMRPMRLIRLESAQLQAALAQLEAGPGQNQGDFVLRAEAQLGKLGREVGRVLQLPLEVQGHMRLQAERTGKAPEHRSYDDSLRWSIDDFGLRSGKTILLPGHRLSLEVRGRQTAEGLASADLRGEWWPGSFELRLRDAQGQGAERRGHYDLHATLLLARLQPLLQHLFPTLGTLNLAGSLNLDLAAELQGATHRLTSLQAVLNKPLFKATTPRAIYSFQANRSLLAAGAALEQQAPHRKKGAIPLTLATSRKALAEGEKEEQERYSFFDPQGQRARLGPWLLLSDGLHLQGDCTFGQWRKGPPHRMLRTHGHMDGAMLATLLHLGGHMPPGLRLQGQTRLALDVDSPGDSPAQAVFAAHLDQVGFDQGEHRLLQERALALYARFERSADGGPGSWNLPEFSVHNGGFWAGGKGFLWHERPGSGMLALQGQYRRTAAGAKAQAPEPAPFQLTVPLR